MPPTQVGATALLPTTQSASWVIIPLSFAADIMILLTDGSVLIHTAQDDSATPSNQWHRLWPQSTAAASDRYRLGNVKTTGTMTSSRQYFASGVLRDGRVFAIGGELSDAGADTPKAEIYDPVTERWSTIAKPAQFDFVRGDASSCVLASGKVLLGGATPDAVQQSGGVATWSTQTAVWDPSAGDGSAWTETGLDGFGNQTKVSPAEEETWVLLPDGSVLAPSVTNPPTVQRFDPTQGLWMSAASSPSNLAITTITVGGNAVDVYEIGPMILLPNGNVFAIGGPGDTAVFAPDGGQGSWTAGPSFPNAPSAGVWRTLTALDAPACLLPSGHVVCVGGTMAQNSRGQYFSAGPVFFDYDPKRPTLLGQLDRQPPISQADRTFTYSYWLLPLPTGQMLCSNGANELFLYTPGTNADAPDPSWKPTITAAPSAMSAGTVCTLTGTQFNGLSQAACYGDDGGMATNYPIVELADETTGVGSYARTFGFSTMGVATGNAPVSCSVEIPSSTRAGTYRLTVIANGIRSDPRLVTIS